MDLLVAIFVVVVCILGAVGSATILALLGGGVVWTASALLSYAIPVIPSLTFMKSVALAVALTVISAIIKVVF